MNPDKTAIEKLWERHHFVTEGLRQELMTKKSFLAAFSEAEGERWVSVEERLPGPVENPEKFGSSYWGLYIVCVLAPNISEGPIVIPATWTGKWRNDGGFDLNVTHWQPLPAPPKEKP